MIRLHSLGTRHVVRMKLPTSTAAQGSVLLALLGVLLNIGLGPMASAQSGEGETSTAARTGLVMVTVPIQQFKMGCNPKSIAKTIKDAVTSRPDSGACFKSASPKHTVKFKHQFSIGSTEVTQGVWQEVMAGNPSYNIGCGSSCPVEQVSWYDAIEFTNRLSIIEGLEPCYEREGDEVRWPNGYQCMGYRLPTESEWEAAARGSVDRALNDRGSRMVGQYGWLNTNSEERTHPVATKRSDTLGLYDMRGNVAEGTWDRFGRYKKKRKHSLGPKNGNRRVFRGGSAFEGFKANRRIRRSHWLPAGRDVNIGFRLARTVVD